ncbi:MAG TPA: cupredoxin domain-containing protein [Nevskiaceae bacterium]|nr:cupredoxin domain-containing protein [Nevskiaceae bacterium]
MNLLSRLTCGAVIAACASLAFGADAEFTLTIRDHKFEPAELTVPAGQKIKLTVKNEDATAEEFESHELNREKVIVGKSSGTVYVGPLSAGSYPFFGDFNQDTAQGKLIAK